jgi:hypothetical protein
VSSVLQLIDVSIVFDLYGEQLRVYDGLVATISTKMLTMLAICAIMLAAEVLDLSDSFG